MVIMVALFTVQVGSVLTLVEWLKRNGQRER
jgi:hypothetical protein